MNVLTYKGLPATVAFDAEDMILTGRIAGIKDVVGFHADTPEELAKAFHEAVDDYLDARGSASKPPLLRCPGLGPDRASYLRAKAALPRVKPGATK